MSQSLHLQWNDFESIVSKSFASLREEKDFYDVTLVSDDEKEYEAHKLVLSACSPFFKNLLKGKSHPAPMLYLSGISSTELDLVLDYIYHGEVQVENTKIDRFLSVAGKLKLEGLQHEDKKEEEIDEKPFVTICSPIVKLLPTIPKRKSEMTIEPEYSTTNIHMSYAEPQWEIDELREKLVEEKSYRCKPCGKITKLKGDINRHIETHLEGLSHSCPSCEKTFRSASSLSTHQNNQHRSRSSLK